MIQYLQATDFLGHSAPLAYQASFPVLGVPVEFLSNSPAVIAAAERSFAHWRAVPAQLVAAQAPRVVRVLVHAGARPSVERAPFTHRAHSGWLLASCGESMLAAQMDRGEALASVTPELVADEEHFRYHVIESMALALASRHDRTPIHAGAVVHAGQALLLAGHSTAGKSTLCYACVRDGFQLLAEDVIYVSMHTGFRIWGNARYIHLLPDAPRFFAELADVPPRIQANGKRKLAVDLAAQGPDRLRHTAERAAVCLIERGSGAASTIEPIAPGQLIVALGQNREPGFDLFDTTRAAAEALVRGGAFRLTVGSELAGAVALLRQLAERL